MIHQGLKVSFFSWTEYSFSDEMLFLNYIYSDDLFLHFRQPGYKKNGYNFDEKAPIWYFNLEEAYATPTE